jgi:hypothetical protein
MHARDMRATILDLLWLDHEWPIYRARITTQKQFFGYSLILVALIAHRGAGIVGVRSERSPDVA